MRSKPFYQRVGKRTLDVITASLSLVLLSPLLLVVPFAVLVSMGAPDFFTQTRPGLHGRLFNVLKFRTMTNARDETGELLPDADQMTRVGLWLRSTSIDELPELITCYAGR